MEKVLTGKKILITRSAEKSEAAVSLLKENGAEVFFVHTNKIVPMDDYSKFNIYVKNLNEYSYIVFTSGNAVEYFLKKSGEIDLSKIKIAAVGKKTAQVCEESGIEVDIVPDNFSAEGLIEKFKSVDPTNKKILIPGSAISREELRNGLDGLGFDVDFIAVYDVAVPTKEEIMPDDCLIESADIFAFTSPSTFNNFLSIFEIENVKDFFNKKILAVIGPTTESALIQKGLHPKIVPDEFTMNGLTKKIIEYYT